MSSLTSNQHRLLRFVVDHVPSGDWTHLGEDALPDALVLDQMGLVEVNGTHDKYRLVEEPSSEWFPPAGS